MPAETLLSHSEGLSPGSAPDPTLLTPHWEAAHDGTSNPVLAIQMALAQLGPGYLEHLGSDPAE